MKTIIIIISMMVCACGSGELTIEGVPLSDKVSDYQQREATCPSLETGCDIIRGGGLRFDIVRILNEIDTDLEYSSVNQSYWKSSCEAMADGYGDCEDFAAVAHRAMSDSCLHEYYDDVQVAMRTIRVRENVTHRVVIVYAADETAYIDMFSVYRGEPKEEVQFEF